MHNRRMEGSTGQTEASVMQQHKVAAAFGCSVRLWGVRRSTAPVGFQPWWPRPLRDHVPAALWHPRAPGVVSSGSWGANPQGTVNACICNSTGSRNLGFRRADHGQYFQRM